MVARPSAPPLLVGVQGAKAYNLDENQARWIVPGDRASLTAEEAVIVAKSLATTEILFEDEGLSAEKENRVHSSGVDSLIFAFNQVMLKVLLRAGPIATWTSLQMNLDSHGDLGCVGLGLILLQTISR